MYKAITKIANTDKLKELQKDVMPNARFDVDEGQTKRVIAAYLLYKEMEKENEKDVP